jgi:hypothetical protein
MRSPTPDADKWLQGLLREAVGAPLCTDILCTTCGVREFRNRLLQALRERMGVETIERIDRAAAIGLAQGLAAIPAEEALAGSFEMPVRLVLFDLWHSVGEAFVEREVAPILDGSWAGQVLDRMKAHYQARQDARRQHSEQNDPAQIEVRRAAKRRSTEDAVALRMAAKQQRDRERQEEQQGRGAREASLSPPNDRLKP